MQKTKKLKVLSTYRKSIAATVATVAIATSLLLPSTAEANSFKDVKDNHWANSSIEQASKRDLISGYTDGTFRPNNKVTRAEFAAFLSRLSDVNERVAEPFSDVSNTHWAKSAIEEGIALGFINPSDYPNKKFEPNKAMTRAEIAQWLTNGLIASNQEYEEIEQTLKSSSLTLLPVAEFTKGTLSKNDVGSVGVMIGTGLITGYTDGTFKPSGNTNRSEVASILLRYLNTSAKDPSDIQALNELVEVAETGTNFYTMGGEFIHEDKGRNWESLKKETHLMRNGNGTLRANRMILVDTRDLDNVKGIYKNLFEQMAKASANRTHHSSMFVAVEHAYNPIKQTQNADWYTKISPSHSLFASSIVYKDTRFGLPTSSTYRTGWKFDKNGEQLMWHGTTMFDRFKNGKPYVQHSTSGRDYTMIVNK